jgi:ABC-type dipeptide/oligopeptide/nickel transport system permease component
MASTPQASVSAMHTISSSSDVLSLSNSSHAYSTCIGGSLVVEKLFSIGGMGSLLSDAVYTLDYPLMQGILFVTTAIMTVSIVVTDLICILIDPKVRFGGGPV